MKKNRCKYMNRGLPKKVKENEFTWMVEQSKYIDKHLKKIHNGLRNNTLEELIHHNDDSINKRYRQLYNFSVHYMSPSRRPDTDDEYRITNLNKNIHNSKVKHNILMIMYDEQYNNLPWFKRMFKKRIKSDYYGL